MNRKMFDFILRGNEIFWKDEEKDDSIAKKNNYDWKICLKPLDETSWEDSKKELLEDLLDLLKNTPNVSQIQLTELARKIYINHLFSSQNDFE